MGEMATEGISDLGTLHQGLAFRAPQYSDPHLHCSGAVMGNGSLADHRPSARAKKWPKRKKVLWAGKDSR